MNACSTNVALFKRECVNAPLCVRCGVHEETISHLFLECKFAKRVRRLSSLGFNFEVGPDPLYVYKLDCYVV